MVTLRKMQHTSYFSVSRHIPPCPPKFLHLGPPCKARFQCQSLREVIVDFLNASTLCRDYRELLRWDNLHTLPIGFWQTTLLAPLWLPSSASSGGGAWQEVGKWLLGRTELNEKWLSPWETNCIWDLNNVSSQLILTPGSQISLSTEKRKEWRK